MRDLFDIAERSQPGERQTDIELIIEEKAMNLTDNEIKAMKACLNYRNREDQMYDNFSDTGPVDIAKELGWDMHQVGGLLASLENKGMAWVDDRSDDSHMKGCGTDMHIVWLTEKGVNAIFDIIEKEGK